MLQVISDKGHLRGMWDPDEKKLTVKVGKLTVMYHQLDDDNWEAQDIWEKKNRRK